MSHAPASVTYVVTHIQRLLSVAPAADCFVAVAWQKLHRDVTDAVVQTHLMRLLYSQIIGRRAPHLASWRRASCIS